MNLEFYDETTYDSVELAETVSMVTWIVGVSAIFLSIFVKSGFPIIQMFTALQVYYFSLSSLSQI